MNKIKNWLKKLLFGETYKKEINRSAVTGEFVSKDFVEENPGTTITEVREVKKRGKSKKE
jgi:hypothetical protein